MICVQLTWNNELLITYFQKAIFQYPYIGYITMNLLPWCCYRYDLFAEVFIFIVLLQEYLANDLFLQLLSFEDVHPPICWREAIYTDLYVKVTCRDKRVGSTCE